MKLKLAENKDLPALEAMFKEVVENMYKNGITIWNEFYPFEEFAIDIANKNLYLLTNEDEIIAAFGIYNNANGENCFEWQNKNAKAVYLGRVGVNVNFLRQGIGEQVLKQTLEIAKQKNAKFLRLLVSDINTPAINLYRKNGFTQSIGVYNEFSETLGKNITELGFEMEVD